MKSIKTKLIVLCLSFSCAIAIILSVFSIVTMSLVSDRIFNSLITPYTKETAKYVSSTVSDSLTDVTAVAKNSKIVNLTTDDERTEAVTNLISDMGITNFYFYSVNGKLLTTSYQNNLINSDTDFSKTEEFNSVIENKKTVTSNPYTYAVDKFKNYVVYSTYIPLLKYNDLVGVIVYVQLYENVNNVVSAFEFSENSSTYLIDKKGNITTDIELLNIPVLETEGTESSSKNMEKLASEISAQYNGLTTFSVSNTPMLAGYAYIEELDSYLILSAPVTDFVDIQMFIFACVGIALVLMILSFIFVRANAKKVALPIISVSERLKALSEGNLSDPVRTVNTNDELQVLSESLQETVQSLNEYIVKITKALSNISSGNLTDRVHGSFYGDFIQIKSSFNTIILSLIDTFSGIINAAEEVNSGANQVSNGSQALSQGATEQASAIEELSATIYEVATQITNNAKAAKDAELIVDSTTSNIISCNDDMNQMLDAMNDINKTSHEISKIIKVIDDIAFQTNILALNAAVEAARAGAAGKGFAVVADEVRSLASKSAEAASQTASLIENSLKSVSQGAKYAQQTSGSLNEIVEKAKKINDIVKDISTASEQQAESISQINSGIDQISAVVQNNTATAEESAAASEELSNQSLILRNMVSKFKIGDKNKIFNSNTNVVGISESSFDFDSSNSDSEFEFKNIDASQFNFSSDDTPSSEFNFSSDDEPASEFDFSSNEEPASEFNFSSDDEPASEFDFTSSLGDDFKISLDDDDNKY